MAGSSIIAAGHYSRSIFVEQPGVDDGTVMNSCLSPAGIAVVNFRDKVNPRVFGAN